MARRRTSQLEAPPLPVAPLSRSPVWIDAGRRFGRPCMTGTSVLVDVIVDLHAAGEPIEAIAREYGVRPQAIVAVLAWHRAQQPEAWRAVWAVTT